MSLPSSPSPSSGSDDFAALLDAELLPVSSSDTNSGLDKEGSPEIQENQLESEPSRKRKRMEDDVEPHAENKNCPPHPGFMWDVCIRCGALKPASFPDEQGVALRYIHEGLEVTQTEANRIRTNEYEKVLASKKLYLVLDLDHTLLNSARFVEVSLDEHAYISSLYSLTREPADGPAGTLPPEEEKSGKKSSLYALANLHMFTKLRPFAHQFLEKASTMFEMHLYTMGERIYADAMARLLDPSGRFFGSRVISQTDSTFRNIKDLDIMLGAESAVIILDDTEGVWPRHKANLILTERYHFFSASCKQFGISNASLVEAQRDESEDEGTLANMIELLKSVHAAFFDNDLTCDQSKDANKKTRKCQSRQDVRKILGHLRSKVLSGCKVVFSRIFPTALPSPENHPIWCLAEELGAFCTSTLDESVTHVVALDKGTDKAKWALQHKRHLVHPRWIEAALYTWKRPDEKSFAVDDAQLLSTFSKTISVEQLDDENNNKDAS